MVRIASRRASAACGAMLAVLAAAVPARADDAGVNAALAQAWADRAALRYRQALDGIERALARGAASPAQMAEMYRMAGELAAGLDEPSSAQRWFARWVALVPDARLPADASPKLRAPMDAARAELGGARLALRVDGDGRVVRVHVAGDALGLVRRVRVRPVDGGGGQAGLPGEPIIMTPDGPAVAAALDEHGNELLAQPVAAGDAGGGAATDARGSRSIAARWETWALAGGALAIGGGGFAWRTAVAQDEFDRLRGERGLHTFEELEDVRRRGERHALVANVAFGAAAATAVVGAILWVRGRDGDEPAVRLGATIAPGQAGVAITARF